MMDPTPTGTPPHTPQDPTQAQGPFPRTQSLAALIIYLALITVVVVVLILLVPIFLIATIIFGILSAAIGVIAWFRRQKRPNGILDGRKNVRVRKPGEP